MGIGTAAPDSKLTINGNTAALPSVPTAGTNIQLGSANGGQLSFTYDGFGATGSLIGRRAQGTAALPSALGFAGYNLLILQTAGYGTTEYSSPQTAFAILTDEGWTDSAQGTEIQLYTVPNGSTGKQQRVTIDNSGNVGIGTTSPASLLSLSSGATTTVHIGTTATTQGSCIHMYSPNHTAYRLYVANDGTLTTEAGTCE